MTEEPKLIEIAARWEAICDLLKGEEPSDFLLSFPEVRQVQDLMSVTAMLSETAKEWEQKYIEANRELVKLRGKLRWQS